jgi:hypothetical protein
LKDRLNGYVCTYAYLAGYGCADFWLYYKYETKVACVEWKASQVKQMRTMEQLREKVLEKYAHFEPYLQDVSKCEEYKNILYRSKLNRPTKDKIYD